MEQRGGGYALALAGRMNEALAELQEALMRNVNKFAHESYGGDALKHDQVGMHFVLAEGVVLAHTSQRRLR